LASAESPPLGGEPRAKCGITRNLQSLKEVSAEQRVQRSLLLRSEFLHSLCGCARDLDRIDEAVCQVEPNDVCAGMDAPMALRIDNGPELAQAPAQFSARIVGHVPQQFAELGPR